MRVLTCIGLCKEVGHQTYAANAITHFKVRQGSIGAEKHQYDKPLAFPATERTDNYAVSLILNWYHYCPGGTERQTHAKFR